LLLLWSVGEMPYQQYYTYGYPTTGTSTAWGYQSSNVTTITQPMWYSNTGQLLYAPAGTRGVTDAVWRTWVTTPSITTSTYTDQVWQTWVNTPGALTPVGQEANEYRQQTERYQAERHRLGQERRAASARARILLGEFLTEEQKTELERHGRFHVTGSKGRRYCIRTTGQSGNVDLLTDKGEVQASLCAHPCGYLPDGDAWLMQMLEIRNDEDHFLRTANVHRGRLPAGAR
jgi:hypothetical protein